MKLKMEELKKLSLNHCRKVLQKAGKSYSEEQINQVRLFLKSLADIAYKAYRNTKK